MLSRIRRHWNILKNASVSASNECVGFTDTAQNEACTLRPDWVSRGSSKRYPTLCKYTISSTLRGQTQEPEPTPGKLLDDLGVTASPYYVRDLRYSTTQSILFDLPILYTFIPTCAITQPQTSHQRHLQAVDYNRPRHLAISRADKLTECLSGSISTNRVIEFALVE